MATIRIIKKVYTKPVTRFHKLEIQRIGIETGSNPDDNYDKAKQSSISFDDSWDDVKDEW